jgi:hypothetical protein
MADMLVCRLCRNEEKEFKVPLDEIGSALMKEHLREVHELY